jgi:hypothetical protein
VTSAVDALKDAIAALEEGAVDLTMEDAAHLSDCQVRLGELVLQVVETAKTMQDLERPA